MNKNFLQDILKKLKNKGAAEAEVIFSNYQNKSASCRLGKVEKIEESETKEIGIRVIIKKKQSIISSTNIEVKNIDNLVDRVIEMAGVVPKDEFCGLANENIISKPKIEEIKKLALFDSFEPSINDIKKKVTT